MVLPRSCRKERPVLLEKSWSVWSLVQPALKDALKGLDSR